MSDLIKLYNPANASALTPEQTEGLQKLTSAEIKELALAYPNMTMQRAYLLIIDSTKAPGKQLPTLSSFENLWNLREKNGLRNYVAYGFKGIYKPVSSKVGQTVKAKKTEVLDLSETELMSLPGFKKLRSIDDPNFVPAKDFDIKERLLSTDVNSLPDYLREDAKKLKEKFEKELPQKVKVTKIKKIPVTAKIKKSK